MEIVEADDLDTCVALDVIGGRGRLNLSNLSTVEQACADLIGQHIIDVR
jgi:hypothetical protein